MNPHVTLKLKDGAYVRVHSGPSVRCVYERWSCGVCGTYASTANTYRVLSKTCAEHACLIPKAAP